jgi:hypothetical protein
MHAYATDSNERTTVISGLAVISVGVAWTFSRVLSSTAIPVPWWFDAPSTMGIFAILYKVFDRCLWRIQLLHRIRLLKVPLLAGKWRGHVVSSFEDHKKTHEVTVQIKQTWTKIAVLLSSDTSRSHTLTAAVEVHAPEGVVLSYQYENQPQPDAVKTMEIHIGTARLTFADGRSLEGYYYSGRGRQEYGQLFLERVPN